MTYNSEPEKFAVNTYSKEVEDLTFLLQSIRENKRLPPLVEPSFDSSVPIFVVGHSRGGFIGFITAIEQPNCIAGVVTWSGHFDDLEAIYTRSAVREMREFGHSYYGSPKNGLRLDVELLHDLDRHQERFDVYRHGAEASVPMLFVQGANDFVFIQKASAKLVKLNTLFSRVVIQGANHTFGIRHPFVSTTPALEEAIAKTNDFIEQVVNKEGFLI